MNFNKMDFSGLDLEEIKERMREMPWTKLIPAAAVIASLTFGTLASHVSAEGESGGNTATASADSSIKGASELTKYLVDDVSSSAGSGSSENSASSSSSDASTAKKTTSKTTTKKSAKKSSGGNRTVSASKSNSSGSGQGSTSTSSVSVPSGGYKDGTYTGSATGYGGTITVKVTVSGGKITAIDVTDHSGETDSYYQKATGVISQMLSSGTPNADAVSGATYSSNGIIKAVQNALANAGSSSSSSSGTSSDKNTKKTSSKKATNKKITTKSKTYADGTFTGEGDGWGVKSGDGDPIKVKVTIKNGKITKLTIANKDGETDQYFNTAWPTLKKKIIKSNTASGIDTVTGATYSSKGIITAVDNALQKSRNKAAKVTPTPTAKPTVAPTATPTVTAAPTATPTSTPDVMPEEDYKEGSYEGESNSSESGTIKVKVTISSNGRISDIDLLSYEGDKAAFTNAWCGHGDYEGIRHQILKTQSTKNLEKLEDAEEICQGIIDAVDAALAKAVPQKKYLDGTYTGKSVYGYQSNVTATVTIENGKITEVTCQQGESSSFWRNAFGGTNKKGVYTSGIRDKILENQGVSDADAVTGATFSSKAIIGSVKDALEQAKNPDYTEEGDDSKPDDAATTPTPSASVTPSVTATPSASATPSVTVTPSASPTPTPSENTLKDGTYTGTGTGYSGKVTVTLTVKDGKITDLSNTNSDTAIFFAHAWSGDELDYQDDFSEELDVFASKCTGLKEQILAKQGTDGIDTISGATYSSKGILAAVKDALVKAKS